MDTASNNLSSVGMVATTLQIMPHRIMHMAAELHIEPAMRLNNIAYFDDRQVEAIAAALQKGRSEK